MHKYLIWGLLILPGNYALADRLTLKEARQIVAQYEQVMNGQAGTRAQLILTPKDIAIALRIVARDEARRTGSNSPGFRQ